MRAMHKLSTRWKASSAIRSCCTITFHPTRWVSVVAWARLDVGKLVTAVWHVVALQRFCPTSTISRTPCGWSARLPNPTAPALRSEEHTSELQSRGHLVCRLLLEKKKQ